MRAKPASDCRQTTTCTRSSSARSEKPVELRLKSGEKIAGKLQKVTGTLACVAQLNDASFYDAAVDIESVAAVVVRARIKLDRAVHEAPGAGLVPVRDNRVTRSLIARSRRMPQALMTARVARVMRRNIQIGCSRMRSPSQMT